MCHRILLYLQSITIITMLFKTIIFSDVPVLKGFRYRNRFQLVPFFYSESAPRPEHTRHFPVFLEYEVETIENEYFLDDILYDKGFTEEQIKNAHFIPYKKRVKKGNCAIVDMSY